MELQQTLDIFGNMDIYVIDQILKKRYQHGQNILDAGCGNGRNLKWFYNCRFDFKGVDVDEERLQQAKNLYPESSNSFIRANLTNLPFEKAVFDHILCCAVLHFAEGEAQFLEMFSELERVLKPGGSLLIRTASNIGFEERSIRLKDTISKQSAEFFISRQQIADISKNFGLGLIEPVKTTNVQDERAMTTLVLRK
ncbi:class I SAM-dependent methyltransferase [Gramella sp. GC03-9]|uniref:Class I SAM-dependent methyltransferase n=1 Tax=Christiangramia oceanisediminis TaxID=2920386 RepID=A0A9X2I3D7_9FLAO|nr:class I SAM-dependent methyltransferase [Gramella oceanisediminis]MCP9199970.1 class I SAM-dependent methyltransferase [Gramella oceanisediminis]